MIRKSIFALLVLSFILPAFAQDKVIGEENWKDAKPSLQTQIIKQEKARAVLYTVYMLDDKGKIDHRIALADVQFVRFRARYTVVYNTKVRFHFIWTGPEFYEHTTDWYAGKYGNTYSIDVKTTTNWKTGIYKLVVVAEQAVEGSGAECVADCVIQFE